MKTLVLTPLLLVVCSMAFAVISPEPPNCPEVIYTNPEDGSKDVIPNVVNQEGIKSIFDRQVKVISVTVETDKGKLNWDIPDYADEPSELIILLPKSEDDMLKPNMQVSVTVHVKDSYGNEALAKIGFSMVIGDCGKPTPK